jgi:hypothetical protein
MRALPHWYQEAIKDYAKRIVEGDEDKGSALISLRVLIRDTPP